MPCPTVNRLDLDLLPAYSEDEQDVGESPYARTETKFATALADFWINLKKWEGLCGVRAQRLDTFSRDIRLLREEREACQTATVALLALQTLAQSMLKNDCPFKTIEAHWKVHMRLLTGLNHSLAVLQDTQRGLEKGTTPIGEILQLQALGVSYFLMPMERAAQEDLHEESPRATTALNSMKRCSRRLNRLSLEVQLERSQTQQAATKALVETYDHPQQSHVLRMKMALACYQKAMESGRADEVRVAKKVIENVKRSLKTLPELKSKQAGDWLMLKNMLKNLKRLRGPSAIYRQAFQAFNSVLVNH